MRLRLYGKNHLNMEEFSFSYHMNFHLHSISPDFFFQKILKSKGSVIGDQLPYTNWFSVVHRLNLYAYIYIWYAIFSTLKSSFL